MRVKMAKVKMLVSIAGADFSLVPGDVHEFKEYECANLIREGFAEAVGGIETAAKSGGPERAVKPKARKRK